MRLIVDKSTIINLKKIDQEPTGEFHNLAAAAGLDPKTDFKNVDLRDIVFIGADISGFDFSGANLLGTEIRYCAKANNLITSVDTLLDPEDYLWLQYHNVYRDTDVDVLQMNKASEYIKFGLAALENRNYDEAEYWFITAANSAQENNQLATQIDAIEHLAKLYKITQNYTDAEKCYNVVIELAVRRHDRKVEARANQNLGIIACTARDHERAKLLFLKSLKISEPLRLHRLSAISQFHIGSMHRNSAEYNSASHWFLAALESATASSNTLLTIQSLQSIALVEVLQGNSGLGEVFYRKALRIAEENNCNDEVLICCTRLAELAKQRGYDNAARRWSEYCASK